MYLNTRCILLVIIIGENLLARILLCCGVSMSECVPADVLMHV